MLMLKKNRLYAPCVLLVLTVMLWVSPAPYTAQTHLSPYLPVEGAITAAGSVESWTFSGTEGGVISAWVQPLTDSALDPSITLTNSAGVVISTHDDIAYPGNLEALLQAVTLPRTDTYTLTVSGYGETIGNYRLTLYIGYPAVAWADDFNDDVANHWVGAQPYLAIDRAVGQMTLSLNESGQSGYVLYLPSGEAAGTIPTSYDDFYLHAEIVNANGRNGWMAGFVLRQTHNAYYVLMVNHQGMWRFVLMSANEEQVLREWVSHPAIVANQSNFQLGVLANGSAFDVFYNGIYVGQAQDPAATLTQGTVGVWLGVPNTPNSSAQVAFDALTLTQARTLGDQTLLPMQLSVGGQALTVQELERRGVIPTGGKLALSVPQSSAQRINPGVNRIVLARGTQYGNMVLQTTLRWRAASSGVVGCGLVFANQSETDYALAYLDQSGGYGVSLRNGDTFAPGLYGENLNWTEGNQQLLLVRLGETVHYFINRQYVGTMRIPAQSGEIGVANVNYETIDTTCEFSDTWLWHWE